MIKDEFKDRKKNIDSSKFMAGLYTREVVTENDGDNSEYTSIYTYYCNCGNSSDVARLAGRYHNTRPHTCSKCGNSYFTNIYGIKSSVRMGAFYLKSIRTSYINASRINFTAGIEDGVFKVKRLNMIRDIEIDVLQSKIVVHRNNELEYSKTEKSDDERYLFNSDELKRINTFFKQDMPNDRLFILDILNRASNVNDFPFEEIERSKKFYHAISSLRRLKSYSRGWSEPKYSNIYNLYNLMNGDSEPFVFLEKLINSGVNIDASVFIDRNYLNNKYVYTITNRYNCIDMSKKKLHQQLSCPKGFLKIIRDNNLIINSAMLSSMSAMFCEGASKKDKSMEFLKVAIENNVIEEVFPNIQDIMYLVQNYNYDHETLINYLFVVCPMYQGITSTHEILNLMADYLDMSVKMGFKFDKYPDSLKRAHDIKMVNYKVFKGELEGEEFINAVRQYNDLIFVGDNFQMVVPKDSKDLVKEGSLLHHCIASYKDRVITGRSIIMFMRLKDDVNTPLVSVELNSSYNIVQARGEYNRSLRSKEKEFLDDWELFIKDTLEHRRIIDKKSEIESFQ